MQASSKPTINCLLCYSSCILFQMFSWELQKLFKILSYLTSMESCFRDLDGCFCWAVVFSELVISGHCCMSLNIYIYIYIYIQIDIYIYKLIDIQISNDTWTKLNLKNGAFTDNQQKQRNIRLMEMVLRCKSAQRTHDLSF